MPTVEQVLAALARRQHAVLSGRQVVERGVTHKMLRSRLAAGWLNRLDHDVVHIAGTPVTWQAKVMAAVLAGGPGAGASHRTAAALWGDSTLELLVLALLRERGLPEPVLHHRLVGPDGGFLAEIDLAYPPLRIAIELDGSVHSEREVSEHDRPRQNGIVLQGWIVLRFTWRDLVEHPDEIVAAVRAAIELAEHRA